MTNKQQGEISLDVKGKSYTLRPSMNALCTAEELMEKSLGREMSTTEIFFMVNRGNMRAIRIVLWAYLQAKHAKEFDTVDKVGSIIIDEIGLDAVNAQLQKLMEANEPPKEHGKAATGTNPPEAQVGDGVNSSSPLAESA